MKIAIVHYHLHRGGVTRVIENAVSALAERGHETMVLTGEQYPGDVLPHTKVVQGLGYADQATGDEGRELARKMTSAAREHFGSPPDLWHIHNHSLGKNPALPFAIQQLLEDGARLLLQIHDFAEDGRPANYQRLRDACHAAKLEPASLLYPDAPQVHYAVLNGRDRDLLTSTGLDSARLHFLPNAVAVPTGDESEPSKPETDPFPEAKRFYLYPTRAIRRKNLGEFLALSLLAPQDSLLATTLAPANPEWQSIYKRWQQVARQGKLPVRFGIGEDSTLQHIQFPQWIDRADALLTTSVAEGFGLAFLEPWLFQRPLRGRDLPEITRDFASGGISLGPLYERIPVPVDWIPGKPLRERIRKALQSSHQAYGIDLPQDAEEIAWNSLCRKDGIDFGRMDEPLQESVLQRWIDSPGQLPDPAIYFPEISPERETSRIDRNREILQSHYSLSAYGDNLESTYQSVLDSATRAPEALDATRLLQKFLDPTRLNLLTL